MDQIHTFIGKDWREDASPEERVVIHTLHHILNEVAVSNSAHSAGRLAALVGLTPKRRYRRCLTEASTIYPGRRGCLRGAE